MVSVAQRSTSSRDWLPSRIAAKRASTSTGLGGAGCAIITAAILPDKAHPLTLCGGRLSWANGRLQAVKIIARILHGGLQTAAQGGIRLHMVDHRRPTASAAQKVFLLIFEVPPAGFEPATHGLGMEYGPSWEQATDLQLRVARWATRPRSVRE
ncbi:hypothetical protein GCM10027605_65820 [Micromonospora zhanjiangensis]